METEPERFVEMLGRQIMTQLNLRKDRLDLKEMTLLVTLHETLTTTR